MLADARVALITGAGRGIGAATARALADDGWQLVLFDRCADDPAIPYPLASPADLDAVAHDVSGVAVVGDVRNQADLDRAVTIAIDRFGGVDAAIGVAGCVVGGVDAWDMDDDAWDAVIGVNLVGIWRLARAAVPALLARPEPRHGRFVAVSSAAGSIGLPKLAAYAAANHGVNGLTRSLAAELGPHGITANAVAPGSTVGAMLRASADVYELADPEEFIVHNMLPRLLEPVEIAELLAWLVSEASSAVTGAVLAADAGMTAR
jgi:SDR family mycofactocin-dependent oxidoreductase